jgi:hypothetical protein
VDARSIKANDVFIDFSSSLARRATDSMHALLQPSRTARDETWPVIWQRARLQLTVMRGLAYGSCLEVFGSMDGPQ